MAQERADAYGVPVEELGRFYAERTLLKTEILPEHSPRAVATLVGGDLSVRPARSFRRRGIPPHSPVDLECEVQLNAETIATLEPTCR